MRVNWAVLCDISDLSVTDNYIQQQRLSELELVHIHTAARDTMTPVSTCSIMKLLLAGLCVGITIPTLTSQTENTSTSTGMPSTTNAAASTNATATTNNATTTTNNATATINNATATTNATTTTNTTTTTTATTTATANATITFNSTSTTTNTSTKSGSTSATTLGGSVYIGVLPDVLLAQLFVIFTVVMSAT
ncbi:hypothetical protein QTP70_031474 [Hemibagrus guttatus]|uniref:Uncharacterized protein n=1 Tax=Hemibagrus guttatus TaxID=175788 RepID=A0AAE0QHF9_9TELE|nr:hypothetical protein QTP70_031474 [Hemibagrus guttatus]